LQILLLRLFFQSWQFPLGNQILLKKCFAPSDVTGCSYGHTPYIINSGILSFMGLILGNVL
jgi:hypothetical protein